MNRLNGLKLLLSAGTVSLRLLIAICLALWGGCQGVSWWKAKNAYWVPDEATRAEARQMDAKDIEYIRLQGYNIGHLGDSSQDITDPKMIEVFLDALRNAEMEKPGPIAKANAGDKCDTFEIHFRSRKAWVTPTKVSIPEYCFGPPFQKALVALGKYRADQLYTLAHEHRSHLRKVIVQSDEACNVATKTFRTQQELNTIVKEFDALDENAFAYANIDRTIGIQFTFDDEKKQNVYLVLRDWTHYTADEHPKPLPPIINAYLQQIEKLCRH